MLQWVVISQTSLACQGRLDSMCAPMSTAMEQCAQLKLSRAMRKLCH